MLNKVTLIGRLGSDPEVRFFQNGDQATSISLATTRRWKDRNTNERKEETEWHRVSFRGGLAKIAGDYLKKGALVYVEGRIKTDKWQKDGIDQYRTGIVAESMHMLDSRAGSNDGDPGAYRGGNAPQQQQTQQPQSGGGDYDDFDDDIPFASLNALIRNHLI